MASQNVRRDVGGWISGPALPLSECRNCGVQLQLGVDEVWHAVPYADLSGFCQASTDDERHRPLLVRVT